VYGSRKIEVFAQCNFLVAEAMLQRSPNLQAQLQFIHKNASTLFQGLSFFLSLVVNTRLNH